MDQPTTLSSGIRLVTKSIPTSCAVSIGFYTLTSLIQESDDQNGIAHFLEHMCFKGTGARTSQQITEEIDSIGGVINAHTSREYTCYYVTVLSQHLEKGLEILSDLFTNSSINDKDVALEKKVILEEINMVDDTPDDYIHDLFGQTIWGEGKLGLPILGTTNSVSAIDSTKLKSFYKNYNNPLNQVVSIAGNIPDHDKLVKMIENKLGGNAIPGTPFSSLTVPVSPSSKVVIKTRDIEQVHLILGGQGVPYQDKDHYKVTLLSTLLGGSMSSRLFQSIREKRGWAYSVYSYTPFYQKNGLFSIYAGINKGVFQKTVEVILNELQDLKQTPPTEKEMHRIKEQLKGHLMLGLEGSGAWMTWLAKSTMYKGTTYTVQEVIDKIESITATDLQEMAQTLFRDDQFSLAAVGPLESTEKQWSGQSFNALSDALNRSLS
ncbi:insulinase family protein [bacterium]|jgi:predicted Zn-dependent peptidase|nr:insulinase family protein [bacterium]